MATPTPQERTLEIEKLRVLINDDGNEYLYDDRKLEVFLSFYDDESDTRVKLLKTSIMIISNLAQKYAESVGTRIRINNIEKEITADKSKAYADLLNSLEKQLKGIEKKTIIPIVFGGGIILANKKTAKEKEESGIVPPIFEDEQFDFPPNDGVI